MIPQSVAHFNGQSSYIVSSPNYDMVPGTFTISAWVNVGSATHNIGSCCGAREETVTAGVINGAEGAYIMDAVSDGGLGQINGYACLTSSCWVAVTSPSGVLLPDKWYLETLTYDGFNLRIYLNGVQEGITATSGTIGGTLTSNQIYFGTRANDGSYYNGSLENVQIYNTSLSANELQALYIEGIGGVPINIRNIVGWWPLNGDTIDYSGNGNNGVPSGIAFGSSWASTYTPP